MKSLTLVGLFMLLPMAAQAESQKTESLETLYQKGINAETAERDLDQAIAFYKQVADRRTEDPALAAKAQLRIGFCDERLGRVDRAVRDYQEVITPALTVPAETTQAAQANLDRLQQQAEKNYVFQVSAVSSPSVVAEPHQRLSISLATDFATSHPPSAISGMKSNEPFWWFSAGLGQRYLQAGLEGAISSGGSTDQSASLFSVDGYSASVHLHQETHSYYMGPYGQTQFAWRRVSFYARAGAGLLIRKYRNTPTYTYAFPDGTGASYPSDTIHSYRQNFAMPLALGIDASIYRGLSLGLGLRDLMVFGQQESPAINSIQIYDHNPTGPRIAHWMMPYIRLTYKI